ncbi:MAG: glycosyltransferase, partial [Exiguobacterium sp.]
MRIGLISVNDQPTTAMAPGGTEVFVTSLAKALQNRGHDVTVIASGDSYIEGVRLLAGSPLSFAF